jgi:peptidoglycan/LPS O-acetylase OafA/YrhL
MKNRKANISSLTGIRFFAAFHVVVYHNAQHLESLVPASLPFLGNYLHTGYTGVNLFFVLSGFILAYTYCDPDRPPTVPAERFWVARFARIYPVYALGLVLVAPLVFGHFLSSNDEFRALLKIGVSGGAAATCLQAWIPPLQATWNPPGWTLSVEAFFYALFPFIVPWLWSMERRGALLTACVAWALGLVPAFSILWLSDTTIQSASGYVTGEPLGGFLRTAPIFRLPEFVLGICLARAFYPEPGRARVDPGARRFGSLAVAAVAGILVALALADRIPRLLIEAGLFDPLYGALIVGLASGTGRLQALLSIGILRVLGEASYAIYILQAPIGAWMLRWLDVPAEAIGPALFAAYAAGLIALSVAVFFLVEVPMRSWIRSRVPAVDHRAERTLARAASLFFGGLIDRRPPGAERVGDDVPHDR